MIRAPVKQSAGRRRELRWVVNSGGRALRVLSDTRLGYHETMHRIPMGRYGEPLPARTDVVVVGGGLVGVSVALALAERGISAVLCEKGYVGAEQSSRALGWVRTAGRDPRDLPLALETRQLWQRWSQATARTTGYRASGILFAGATEQELAAYARWVEETRQFDSGARLVGAREAAALLPCSTVPVVGGLFVPGDGRIEPPRAVAALAGAARRRGARIATLCAARGIETQAGRIRAVVTEKGVIGCEAVVVAGGSWSSLFCARLGVPLPQLAVESFVMRTTPVVGPEVSSSHGGLGLRRQLDGGYSLGIQQCVAPITLDSFRWLGQFFPLLSAHRNMTRVRLGPDFLRSLLTSRRWPLDRPSPFERLRVRTTGSMLGQAATWRRAQAIYPAFALARVLQRWGGVIDMTPDRLPVISPIDAVPGLVIATGFSGAGLGTGLGAGYLAADLVTGARPRVAAAPYRYSRFFDGSKLRLAT